MEQTRGRSGEREVGPTREAEAALSGLEPREGAGQSGRGEGTWVCPPGVLKLSR